jgi:hypothetical protein
MKLSSTALNCKADAELAAAASGVCALATAVPNANAANADNKYAAFFMRKTPMMWRYDLIPCA